MATKWHTKVECENCGAKAVLAHDEMEYPDFCPFCGLDGNGAAGSQETADRIKKERNT